MGFFAEGDSEPGGANAWDNMAPLKKDFAKDFGGARQMYADAFNNAAAWAPNAQAATVGPTTIARDDMAARGYQSSNADFLQAVANGGPGGVAESTARANLATAGANTNALAAGRANPNSLAMAMRGAGNANAGMVQGNESQILAMKAQEQNQALNAAHQAFGALRGQDYSLAAEQARLRAAANAANAGFATQTGLANQSAGLAHNAYKQKALGAGADFDRQMYENEMAKKRVERGLSMDSDARKWRADAREEAASGEVVGTMGTAFTTALGDKKKGG